MRKGGYDGLVMLRKIREINEYDIHECREMAAQNKGLRVVYPSSFELQLDIDDNRSYHIYLNVISVLPKGFVKSVEEHPSVSGLPHRHITITLYKEMNELEKIALQFMLGSDRVRESLGVLRYLEGVQQPSSFFEEKHKKK